jgi:uncharacterized membrane protein
MSCVGLFFISVRIMPALVSTIQNLESQMAGFVFMTQVVWLLVPLVLVLLGMAGYGLGILLVRAGSEPAEKSAAGNLQDSRKQHTQDGDDQAEV